MTQEARRTVERFLSAVESRDFVAAHRLLAAPLRARYSPERLALDFELEPGARQRLERIHEALKAPWIDEGPGQGLRLPLGPERSVLLVFEGGDLRLAAIE